MTIKIGTRGSKLALWQAHWVESKLKQKGIPSEIIKIKTTGDQIQDQSLAKIGGKGLFLKEIEKALVDGDVDIAVHSMKDVPYSLEEGLEIAFILEREDPRDALVGQTSLKSEIVGTSSLRRALQLKREYPNITIKDIRGNVDTRLKKLKDGDFDSIVLAAAGLKRLGLESEIKAYLETIPAVGQGAVGIEICSERQDLKEQLSFLNHKKTYECVMIERAFSEKIQGSCQIPLGCYVQEREGQFVGEAFFSNLDGSQYWQESFKGSDYMAALDASKKAAQLMLDSGAQAILDEKN